MIAALATYHNCHAGQNLLEAHVLIGPLSYAAIGSNCAKKATAKKATTLIDHVTDGPPHALGVQGGLPLVKKGPTAGKKARRRRAGFQGGLSLEMRKKILG